MTPAQLVTFKAYLTEDPDALVVAGGTLAAALAAENFDAIAVVMSAQGQTPVVRKIISAKQIINEIAATPDYQSMGSDAVMRLLAPLLIGGDTFDIGTVSGGKAINNAISALAGATTAFNDLKSYSGSYIEALLGQGESCSAQNVSDAWALA